MADELEILKKIEKQIGGKLKFQSLESIMYYKNEGYAIDKMGDVRGLNLDGRTIKNILFLNNLSGLILLSLRDIQITDIAVTPGKRS